MLNRNQIKASKRLSLTYFNNSSSSKKEHRDSGLETRFGELNFFAISSIRKNVLSFVYNVLIRMFL